MRKRIVICALSVLLLILSGVLAFYLHGQNRPIAGLSGDNRTLLRVWMLHSPGGAARWVETQLSAYERQHPGVLIYLRQVSADELTAEETLLPDVVLYRPGDIPDPDGLFLPISGDAPIFAGLLSGEALAGVGALLDGRAEQHLAPQQRIGQFDVEFVAFEHVEGHETPDRGHTLVLEELFIGGERFGRLRRPGRGLLFAAGRRSSSGKQCQAPGQQDGKKGQQGCR